MTERHSNGALTLADYPGDMVRVSCVLCDREGLYNRARLASLLGETASLPDVLNDLARCPRSSNASDPCRARYPDLGKRGR
jgi:hypothetical protein